MKFIINRHNLKNVTITVIHKILANERIGIWVTDKPISEKSRCLFQKQMSKKWWETDDLGRYCNHSLTPNTVVVFYGNQLELQANRQLESGEEILVDYREITNYTGYIPIIDFKVPKAKK